MEWIIKAGWVKSPWSYDTVVQWHLAIGLLSHHTIHVINHTGNWNFSCVLHKPTAHHLIYLSLNSMNSEHRWWSTCGRVLKKYSAIWKPQALSVQQKVPSSMFQFLQVGSIQTCNCHLNLVCQYHSILQTSLPLPHSELGCNLSTYILLEVALLK